MGSVFIRIMNIVSFKVRLGLGLALGRVGLDLSRKITLEVIDVSLCKDRASPCTNHTTNFKPCPGCSLSPASPSAD